MPRLAPEQEGAWDSGSGNAITTTKGCDLCKENERLPAGMESEEVWVPERAGFEVLLQVLVLCLRICPLVCLHRTRNCLKKQYKMCPQTANVILVWLTGVFY